MVLPLSQGTGPQAQIMLTKQPLEMFILVFYKILNLTTNLGQVTLTCRLFKFQ